jgi:hypothetical protein
MAMSYWDELGDRLGDIGSAIVDLVPRLLLAVAILLVGWLIARLLVDPLRKLLERPVVGRLMENVVPWEKYQGGALLASIVYGLIILAAIVLAVAAVDVRSLDHAVAQITSFLWLMVVASVAVILAVLFGRFIAGLFEGWSAEHDLGWVPRVIRVAFIVFGLIVGFDVIGVSDAVGRLIELILATLALIAVIAFGVGGIDMARSWWSKRTAEK